MHDTHHNKLTTLVTYWLEHNQEHRAEFREWADKIAAEHADAAEQLRLAAAKMAEADGFLVKARDLLQ
ncbi:MAG: hypothetical protein ACYC7J_18650 [Syntrophales bacterium]